MFPGGRGEGEGLGSGFQGRVKCRPFWLKLGQGLCGLRDGGRGVGGVGVGVGGVGGVGVGVGVDVAAADGCFLSLFLLSFLFADTTHPDYVDMAVVEQYQVVDERRRRASRSHRQQRHRPANINV